jgi:hypothetical protein
MSQRPEPRPYDVVAINQILDRINTAYGGDLVDYFGADWRDQLRPYLFDVWADGYTTGFADCEGLWYDRRSHD